MFIMQTVWVHGDGLRFLLLGRYKFCITGFLLLFWQLKSSGIRQSGIIPQYMATLLCQWMELLPTENEARINALLGTKLKSINTLGEPQEGCF